MWKHAARVAVVAGSLGMTMLRAAAANPMIFVDPPDDMLPPPFGGFDVTEGTSERTP